MQKNSSEYLPQLTWLRGIAALFVLFSHINRTNEISYAGETYQGFRLIHWLDLGSFGVALFFTLSGCTLYITSSKISFNTTTDWLHFLHKRFFRIWPVFALAVFVYIIAGLILHNHLSPYKETWIGYQFVETYGPKDIVNYLLMIFNFTGPAGLFNNAFWSIPVEFQYYLTLPILIILLNKFGPLSLFAMAAIGHLLYKADFDTIDSTLVFRLFFTFSLGVCAGYLCKNYSFRIPSWLSLTLLFISIVFVYHFKIGNFSNYPMPSEWIVYGLISVFCVLITAMTVIKLPRKLAAILSFYGEISYSLYLFHNLVLALIAVTFVSNYDIIAPYKLLFITIATIFFSTAIAKISYRYIELPCISFGRRFFENSRR